MNLKRIMILLLALVFTLALFTGCSGKSDAAESTAKPSAAPTKAPSATPTKAPSAASTEAPAGDKPVIVTQPEKTTVALGENATFKVEASGEGLTYQWQYSSDNGRTWKSKKDATSPSYTVTAKTSFNGMLYRCRVKNSAGSVKSKSARLTVDGVRPRILTQPESQSAAAGESVTFKVVAGGTNVTYQWQYSKDGGQTWNNKKGATSASYKVTAKAENNGILYRCRVSNSFGKTRSESAQLTVN